MKKGKSFKLFTIFVVGDNITHNNGKAERPTYEGLKFAAFNDRGKDPRTSHDMEDIIYVLAESSRWEQETEQAPEKVKQYLFGQLSVLTPETMLAHLGDTESVKTLQKRIESFLQKY